MDVLTSVGDAGSGRVEEDGGTTAAYNLQLWVSTGGAPPVRLWRRGWLAGVQFDDAGLQVRAAFSGEDRHDKSMTVVSHLLWRMGRCVAEVARRWEAAEAVRTDHVELRAASDCFGEG
jgi:hypothetical protein